MESLRFPATSPRRGDINPSIKWPAPDHQHVVMRSVGTRHDGGLNARTAGDFEEGSDANEPTAHQLRSFLGMQSPCASMRQNQAD